jgi:hypothetical protein
MGAVGAPRLPRVVGAVGPRRLDRRVLLVATKHHLRLA